MSGKHESPFEVVPFTDEEKAEVKNYFTEDQDLVHMGLPGKVKYTLYRSFAEDSGEIYHMPIRPTDIFVATYPRSGTTWTQELVWLLVNGLDFEKAKSTSLTHRYLFLELFMFFKNKANEMRESFKDDLEKLHILETHMITNPVKALAKTPSPRFIKTHLPPSLLPNGALETAKVVYVARDPRDVIVSFYHFAKETTFVGLKCDFKSYYYDVFTKNYMYETPFLEHVKEAWQLRTHPNLLFIFYEELSKDLKGTARRVAQFLGKQYSEQQLQQLADHLSFSNFQKNSAVDILDLKKLGVVKTNFTNFIRKGKVGGWRDHFDAEMSAHATRWMEESLRGTDLRFPDQELTAR